MMKGLRRRWQTFVHRRKFARLGRDCTYPIPHLTIQGHVEQGDIGRFRNNATMRALGNGKIIFGTRAGTSWGVTLIANELIQVGEYTGIAEYTLITDTGHHFADNELAPRAAPKIVRPVRIGKNCFIGSRCFIGPGVTIGDGAVIANNTLITRDVGPLEIWMGAPARLIGHRTQSVPASVMQRLEKLVAEQGIQGDRYKDD